MRLSVRTRELLPGDVVAATGEVVEKVSRSSLTPKGKLDVWLDRRHAVWKVHRVIVIDRVQVVGGVAGGVAGAGVGAVSADEAGVGAGVTAVGAGVAGPDAMACESWAALAVAIWKIWSTAACASAGRAPEVASLIWASSWVMRVVTEATAPCSRVTSSSTSWMEAMRDSCWAITSSIRRRS